jgi:ArsR family transcriptional regulator
VTAASPIDIAVVDRDAVARVLGGLAGREALADTATLFRVLADQTRVTILQALTISPLCNGDLAAVLRISESAVSHQMRELRMMKLVNAERRGRMVYYSLTDSHVKHVLEDTLQHVQEGAR